MKLKVNHEFGSQGRSFRNNAPVPPKYKVYRKSLTSGNNANIFNHFQPQSRQMSTIEKPICNCKKSTIQIGFHWLRLQIILQKNLEIVKIEGFVGKY